MKSSSYIILSIPVILLVSALLFISYGRTPTADKPADLSFSYEMETATLEATGDINLSLKFSSYLKFRGEIPDYLININVDSAATDISIDAPADLLKFTTMTADSSGVSITTNLESIRFSRDEITHLYKLLNSTSMTITLPQAPRSLCVAGYFANFDLNDMVTDSIEIADISSNAISLNRCLFKTANLLKFEGSCSSFIRLHNSFIGTLSLSAMPNSSVKFINDDDGQIDNIEVETRECKDMHYAMERPISIRLDSMYVKQVVNLSPNPLEICRTGEFRAVFSE